MGVSWRYVPIRGFASQHSGARGVEEEVLRSGSAGVEELFGGKMAGSN